MYQAGEVLAGKYRVEKLLGQGGMGVVVAARHLHLQERVAVKLMLPDDGNAEAVERFVREARAAARLESDHVAHVSDVGALGDGRVYLVMEYLDGQDLSQLLASRGRLPPTEAVDYLLQACEAIAEAHSIGIVHRDLKPSNLFLTRRRDRTPHVKVLDFGISKMGTPSMAQIALTETSALMGSPLYMSPEQMVSTKDVDARSDIWALGVVLYELLAAHAPFDGETLPQVCSRVMCESPASLVAIAPGIQRGLAAIVSRCLEKLPDERYQTVAELATALAPYGTLTSFQSVERIQRLQGAQEFLLLAPEQGLPTVAPTTAWVPSVAPGAVKALGTQANWSDSEIPGLQRSRLPWLLGVVAVVVACGAGVFLKVARDNDALGHRPPTVAHAAAPVSTPPTAMATEPRLAASAAPSATSAPLPEPAAVEQSRSAKAPVTAPNPGTKVSSKKSAPLGASAASPVAPEIAPVSAPALAVVPPPPVAQPPVVEEAPAPRSRF